MPRSTTRSAHRSAEPRHAHAVDGASKRSNSLRLKRIEGQVRGVQKMIEDDRYCPDILLQLASVQQALRGVAKELMRHHLAHCARRAMQSSDSEAQAAIEELVAVWAKHAG